MTNWIKNISKTIDIEEKLVEDILNENNIIYSSSMPSPKNLLIRNLYFSGIKEGVNDQKENGPFECEIPFSSGLWCIASNDNLVGKSSVLDIILWLLSGKVSKIQDDVYNWIHKAELKASFNNKIFTVSINKSKNDFSGSLDLGLTKIDFNSEDEFEKVISEYMLKELDLSKVPYWQKDKVNNEIGQINYVGWASYVYALFISGNDLSAIIGEKAHLGFASKLLPLYVGLPWIETYLSASAALKENTQKDKALERINQNSKNVNVDEIGKLTSKKDSLEEELRNIPNEFNKRKELIEEASHNSKILHSELYSLYQNKNKSIQELELINDEILKDKQGLIILQETQAVRSFVKILDPEFCPRCDIPIQEKNKKEEKEKNICAVCGIEHSTEEDIEDYQEKLQELNERIKALQKAYDECNARINTIEKNVQAREDQLEIYQKILQNPTGNNESELYEKQKEIELEISKIKGMLEVRRGYNTHSTSATSTSDKSVKLKIIEQAEKLAAKNSKEIQGSFFDDLNSEVLILAKRFGIDNIESVTINSRAHMLLRKGGNDTSFSKVTAGEKLRLKVALIIGMLRIAEKTGIGRHPGFLLVDSLGNEEICYEDFNKMLSELNQITEEIKDLQVIITSAKLENIKNTIANEKIISPKNGEKYIW